MTESTAEKLIAARDERKQEEEAAIRNMEEYKAALNKICATPDGHIVLRAIMRYCGPFAVKPVRDAQALIADKALRDFYLTMLRMHLTTENRHQLEN